MKKIILFLCCLGSASLLFSQASQKVKGGEVIYFNEDWTPAKNPISATYFTQKLKENDTTYVCRYYQNFSSMVKLETYKDAHMTIPHGRFIWYDENGALDSMGYMYEGKRDSTWYSYDDTLSISMEKRYSKGRLVYSEDQNASKNDTIDRVFRVVDVEAEFPGGKKAWAKYLGSTIETPERFQNIFPGKGGKATVKVDFIVTTTGQVDDIIIEHSCEWSVDMETIRVLKASPRWRPAVMDGKKIRYQARQDITYQVTSR